MEERRYDLDWLRIIAFGVLILYHVGMFYVTWDWHVKSSRASAAIEPLMMLVNPWRLTLLFVISGAATRFMVDRMSVGRFTASRMLRLWPPLLFAIFVIVPPQGYYEVLEALQGMPVAEGSPQTFWLQNFYYKYVTASGNWCDEDGCLITPTYNHMWFVAYLILYTLVLVVLLPLLRKVPARTAVTLNGVGLILVPWLVMFLLRATLFPVFGETHDFRNDWYLHALYLLAFLFGFGVARNSSFFAHCEQIRWMALVIALIGWTSLVWYRNIYLAGGGASPEWLRLLLRGVHELQAWTAIVAAIGFARHYFSGKDGPARRVLTQVIFPFYLIHQTIIVVAAHHLDAWRLPLAIEVTLLIGTTALGCWLFFEIGRRIALLRPLIGLPVRGS